MHVGRAGVGVAEGGGEEFDESLAGVLVGVGDDRRHDGAEGDGLQHGWKVELGGFGHGRTLPVKPNQRVT